jgi:hypothetical protein
MTDLQSLLNRVEKAEGADREIDLDLAFLFDKPQYAFNAGPVPREELTFSNSYTASLDAALALAERAKPGWQWALGTLPEDPTRYGASILPRADVDPFVGEAATPALALLAALIRSLITDAEQ